MINHACTGIMHSHAKTLFKRENAFKETQLLFKWIIFHLNSTNTKENACKEVKRTNLEEDEGAAMLLKALLASRSVLPSVPALSPYSLFVFWVLTFTIFVPLSTGYLHFLLPCSADFICRKWSNRKAVLASFLVFLLLLAFQISQ